MSNLTLDETKKENGRERREKVINFQLYSLTGEKKHDPGYAIKRRLRCHNYHYLQKLKKNDKIKE